ncbi:MAG: aldo/keto reductase [Vicinamibacterales bacterium]
MPDSAIPLRPVGRHQDRVSAIGLGGYHLGTIPTLKEATAVVRTAIDAGVTFMDNAWDYNDGVSEIRMGKALKGVRDQVFLMTKVCTHGRNGRTAMRQLEESLTRLQTDHLDLWQIHECVYHDEPELHFAAGGVVEALDKARQQGKVRYVGFTGHKDPAILLRMLARDYPFDACQLPLNGFDATFHSFEQQVLPVLNRRGIAPIGMKSLGGGGVPVARKVVKVADALRYAMSLPVATTVSGIDSMKVLKQNLRIAANFTPMSATEMASYRTHCARWAPDGRFELYKTTAQYDGDEGRRQHGFPTRQDMAL